MSRWSRRLLIGLLVSLGVAIICVGAFWLGMLFGEIRGGTRPAFGEPPLRHPWPLDLPFGLRKHLRTHGALGVIEHIEGNTLTLTGRWGNRVQVRMTPETILRRGKARIRPADLKPGDRLAVIGKPLRAGVIQARVIWVLARPASDD